MTDRDPRGDPRPRRWRSGFDAVGFADGAPRRRGARRPRANSSRAAITATWAGSPSTRGAARRPAGAVARGAHRRRARRQLRARGRPAGAGANGAIAASISVYARGRDYHDTVKTRLKALARWIAARWPGELKVFVDTAPVMEKPLAQQAGLGWQGKHTNLVSRDFGSWLFLGEIYLSLELDARRRRRPTIAAPAGAASMPARPRAFPAPYRLDARRCISYLTIEHKGPIPRELRPLIGNRIYGCDDCLAVCPWNKFARAAREPDFLPRAELTAPRLAELARARRCRLPRAVRRHRRSSASAATASCAMC